jgi:hypothetical protein
MQLTTRQFLNGLHWRRRATTKGGDPSLGLEDREARRGKNSTGRLLNFLHVPEGNMTFG